MTSGGVDVDAKSQPSTCNDNARFTVSKEDKSELLLLLNEGGGFAVTYCKSIKYFNLDYYLLYNFWIWKFRPHNKVRKPSVSFGHSEIWYILLSFRFMNLPKLYASGANGNTTSLEQFIQQVLSYNIIRAYYKKRGLLCRAYVRGD